jgi:hypothetical protein
MRTAILALLLTVVEAAQVIGCSRFGPVDPVEMAVKADLIIRATATGYALPPSDPSSFTTGTPDAVVRFKVEERIKGPDVPSLELFGYLKNENDYNDQAVPYDFVRPGGRSGSCFANTYRRGSEYLLVLKWSGEAYTADWYALGPTNEQLHDSTDPWLIWIRKTVGAS